MWLAHKPRSLRSSHMHFVVSYWNTMSRLCHIWLQLFNWSMVSSCLVSKRSPWVMDYGAVLFKQITPVRTFPSSCIIAVFFRELRRRLKGIPLCTTVFVARSVLLRIRASSATNDVGSGPFENWPHVCRRGIHFIRFSDLPDDVILVVNRIGLVIPRESKDLRFSHFRWLKLLWRLIHFEVLLYRLPLSMSSQRAGYKDILFYHLLI